MRFLKAFFAYFAFGTLVSAAEAPTGNGQLETPPAIIPGGTDDEGREFSYLAQPAGGGKIVLTASNGFFDKGVCRAAGESSLPKVGDDELIKPNFGYLESWKSTDGSIKWYVLVKEPGSVSFEIYLETDDAGSKIEIQLAGQTQTVTTTKSNGDSPQSWDVSFNIAEPGEYQVALRAGSVSGSSGIGKLHRIDLFGSAIETSHLLRVRWRPAAAHGGYSSDRASNPKLLVMTTRSTQPISSYSPVTTPFGYYGTSFMANQRSNGEFNFSMWGKEGDLGDFEKMPHLIGIGSPEGEFSGFGHEGSGVKARGWTPMPDQPKLCVQALRVESDDRYDTYYGYFFDHPTNAWKFYCAGKKWHGGKPKESLSVGSFCEVPGPPQVERTGDIYREVRRRGWYYEDGKWTAMETFSPGGTGAKGEIPVNKRWFTSADGEFAMGCGGIRLYTAETPAKPALDQELPAFLTSESVANLFTLPIEFGEIRLTQVGSTEATIEVPIEKGEALAVGAVYFGEKDALTFAPRELHGTEKKSELSQSLNDGSWPSMVEVAQFQKGANAIRLSDLKPGTTYFARVLVNNEVSRVWNDQTITFTTPTSGGAITPPAPMLEGESSRTWTYTIGGETRELEGELTSIRADKIEIKRAADGKKGLLELKLFSEADRAYVEERR